MKMLEAKDYSKILKSLVKINSDNAYNKKNNYVPMFGANEDAIVIASLIKSLQAGRFKDENSFISYCTLSMVLANVIMQQDKLDLSVFEEGGNDGKKL